MQDVTHSTRYMSDSNRRNVLAAKLWSIKMEKERGLLQALLNRMKAVQSKLCTCSRKSNFVLHRLE